MALMHCHRISVPTAMPAANITARAEISSHDIAAQSDFSGESGNWPGPCMFARRARYRLAEIAVNENDYDQEKYGKPQQYKAFHISFSLKRNAARMSGTSNVTAMKSALFGSLYRKRRTRRHNNAHPESPERYRNIPSHARIQVWGFPGRDCTCWRNRPYPTTQGP
jgi:hypothetical protein